MSKKKQSRFSGKVSGDSHKQQTKGSAYGYLLLPKGVTVYKETAGGKALFDIIPYQVTDEKHMDRDVELDIAMTGDPW